MYRVNPIVFRVVNSIYGMQTYTFKLLMNRIPYYVLRSSYSACRVGELDLGMECRGSWGSGLGILSSENIKKPPQNMQLG